MGYTVEGTWQLLKRHGWSWQQPARRAIERDDVAVVVWKKETWPRGRASRRSARLPRLRGRGWAIDDSAALQDLGRIGRTPVVRVRGRARGACRWRA
ncbi:winged helix-turn-helix domain-containing protein [Streptomyces sp. NPDC004284]|uniref:winged helix-turn-helix domain-containing protein n=1 Tax=Streptomyces sp. NPDC004284 TaxID=3364695 RepID=UPI00368A4C52